MTLDPSVWSGIFDFPPPARPRGTGQIVGMRLCNVAESDSDGGDAEITLLSLGYGDYCWQPGVNQATCDVGRRRQRALGNTGRRHRHVAPMRDCSCGFYAGTDVAKLHRVLGGPVDGHVVLCGVQAWGKYIVHDWGFRAQYARIVAISDQLPSRVVRDVDGGVISVQARRGIERDVAAYLAEKYHATLTDLVGMASALRAYGDFLKEEQ